jgi:hypothetical protein
MEVSNAPLQHDDVNGEGWRHFFADVGDALKGYHGQESRTNNITLSGASVSPTRAIISYNGYTATFSINYTSGVQFTSTALQIDIGTSKYYTFEKGMLRIYDVTDGSVLGVGYANGDTITFDDINTANV